MRKGLQAVAILAGAALAAGCGGPNVERLTAAQYWRIKRHSVAPMVERANPKTGEIKGTYWMGRSERPTFSASLEEVKAFADANPRIVEEAGAHALGVKHGYEARRRAARTYNPVFTRPPRPPYRERRLANVYKEAWYLGWQYGQEDEKAYPHLQP